MKMDVKGTGARAGGGSAGAAVRTDAGTAGRVHAAATRGVAGAGVNAEAGGPALMSVRGLACGYGQRTVLGHVSFDLREGQVLALLGPNGVGKTTLFKTLLGFMRPLAGEVLIKGRSTSSWNSRDFAREVAYIPQLHTPSFSYSVHDVVLMGRTPYVSGMSSPSAADEAIAHEVIEELGIAHLARRDYSSLSGGERQMVLIARALAQQPSILVMDEPCASLDFGNQAVLLEQVLRLAAGGMAIVMTTHDPNHAFLLDGDVLCLARGGEVHLGAAREVLTPERLTALYGVTVAVGSLGGETACVARLHGSEKQGDSDERNR